VEHDELEVGAGDGAKPAVDRLDFCARLGVDAPEDRLSEQPFGEIRESLKRVAGVLREADVPFLLAGGLAVGPRRAGDGARPRPDAQAL
jgi:hypothetical protein